MHLQRIAPLLLALIAASVNPALARVLPGARNTIRNSPSAFIPRHRSLPLQSTSDTCLYVNSTTLSDLSFQGLPSGIDLASESCLCISELSSILRRDSSAELVKTLEYTEVEQTLEAYIASSTDSQVCTYPAHSKPACTSDDVCGYVCEPPFVAVGDSCTCAEAHGCEPTPPPPSYKARRRLAKRAAISTLAAAQSTCQLNETVCGAYDGTESSFQCVNVDASLESCGGCTIPSPFGLRFGDRASGVDCTVIPYVDAVSCASGRCTVQSCLAGWAVSAEQSGCIQEQPNVQDASTLLELSARHDPSNTTTDESVSRHTLKPHSDYLWRIPDYRSVPPEEESTDPEVKEARGTRLGLQRPKEDWTRIPDIRRFAVSW
ncbi:hypothetical protein C8Q76DRAFT_637176 [Earliella scabrosa]|nr:hypothetical protein C8Q76DRAFT_637176 [Earliella scabrosa]